MKTEVLEIDTSGRTTVDITPDVLEFCSHSGDGLCNVFVPHATAGLALVETGAGSDEDLVVAIADLLPRDGRWTHRHGSPGHGADHVLPAFISPSVVLPVIGGRPGLGQWQSVVLVDTNVDNPRRQVRLSFLAG